MHPMTCPLPDSDPMDRLFVADPDCAAKVQSVLGDANAAVGASDKALMVDETIWALSQETAFGTAVALGFAALAGKTGADGLRRYAEIVHAAGQKGPTLGRLMATYLVPVIGKGTAGLLERFLQTVRIMSGKGTYTLKGPLDLFKTLLESGDLPGGSAYLRLLADTFAQEMTYNRSMLFTRLLPRAVRLFTPQRRLEQVRQLARIVRTDLSAVEPFLDGMEKGLYLLSAAGLERFVSRGLQKYRHRPDAGLRFLSLESRRAVDALHALQITVGLPQVARDLNRYLCARCGPGLSVCALPRPLEKPALSGGTGLSVFSDARHIYLPAEISHYDRKCDNAALYKCLTRFEAGLHEFGTFDFDLERLKTGGAGGGDTAVRAAAGMPALSDGLRAENRSDLELFLSGFPSRRLAGDLFTVFEHGRVRMLLTRIYPGLIQKALPLLQQEAVRMSVKDHGAAIFQLYLPIALDMDAPADPDTGADVAAIVRCFKRAMHPALPGVETSAELMLRTYDRISKMLAVAEAAGRAAAGRRLVTPFGRRIRPGQYAAADRPLRELARAISARLARQGIRVYKSDIRRKLAEQGGRMSPQDVRALILSAGYAADTPDPGPGGEQPCPMPLDLAEILGAQADAGPENNMDPGAVTWYREWHAGLNDYLQAHVRVRDREITGVAGDFYRRTLRRYRGLVKRMRASFELLKPEGLILLRRWLEGDEFDYRALLDFALDKRAGRMPDDRLYVKRVKQQRDVAVLLLVDLSRSTGNSVSRPGAGEPATVLDIEKEAIVLFCEALAVVGDTFALAGFSGSGRQGVDYFHIKDFDMAMDPRVCGRINAIAPQRSTRMGAAIRHAAAQLATISAKVRLLIVIGDGFPNDIGYKGEYAVADTRRAMFEARSKAIFTHAITVNITPNAGLADLYGSVNHTVISDVRELPDRLLGIYGALTH